MKSNLFRLDIRDFSKGLVVAVLVVVLGSIQQALGEHGLDFAAFDWSGIFEVAVTAAVAYLSKNFLSDNNDKVLGRF